jgi:hypothetical protein
MYSFCWLKPAGVPFPETGVILTSKPRFVKNRQELQGNKSPAQVFPPMFGYPL